MRAKLHFKERVMNEDRKNFDWVVNRNQALAAHVYYRHHHEGLSYANIEDKLKPINSRLTCRRLCTIASLAIGRQVTSGTMSLFYGPPRHPPYADAVLVRIKGVWKAEMTKRVSRKPNSEELVIRNNFRLTINGILIKRGYPKEYLILPLSSDRYPVDSTQEIERLKSENRYLSEKLVKIANVLNDKENNNADSTTSNPNDDLSGV